MDDRSVARLAEINTDLFRALRGTYAEEISPAMKAAAAAEQQRAAIPTPRPQESQSNVPEMIERGARRRDVLKVPDRSASYLPGDRHTEAEFAAVDTAIAATKVVPSGSSREELSDKVATKLRQAALAIRDQMPAAHAKSVEAADILAQVYTGRDLFDYNRREVVSRDEVRKAITSPQHQQFLDSYLLIHDLAQKLNHGVDVTINHPTQSEVSKGLINRAPMPLDDQLKELKAAMGMLARAITYKDPVEQTAVVAASGMPTPVFREAVMPPAPDMYPTTSYRDPNRESGERPRTTSLPSGVPAKREDGRSTLPDITQ